MLSLVVEHVRYGFAGTQKDEKGVKPRPLKFSQVGIEVREEDGNTSRAWVEGVASATDPHSRPVELFFLLLLLIFHYVLMDI